MAWNGFGAGAVAEELGGEARRLLRGAFAELLGTKARERSYRRRLLLLLTLVLALDYADRTSLGALAPDLKDTFGISNTQIGVLASAFSIVAAVGTLPAGMLVDRTRRTAVLGVSILLWTVAMAVGGLATSFAVLLGSRIVLGAVTATARPSALSLTGDVFPLGVRGRALGVIDSGDLVGSGVALFAAAGIAAVASWRGVFWALGACGVALAVAVWRLEEPARGGRRDEVTRDARPGDEAPDVEPDPELVLRGDQARMPLWRAVRYVLRIRTNAIVMVSVALGAFFFAGIRTFAIVFAVHAYGLGRSAANVLFLTVGVGALLGLLVGGRLGDALVRRGHPNGRLVVASYSYLVAAVALVPALLLHSVWPAIPCLLVGGATIVAPTAPLDAVRLDLVHPQLWGRAEGVRNLVQIGAEAGSPLLFGILSDSLLGGGEAGLRLTFLISLAALVVAALLLLLGRRFYPREAAAAAESDLGG